MQGLDKLWMPLAGRITLARTIDVFQNSPLINTIILVTSTKRVEPALLLSQEEGWHKVAAVVAGGRSLNATRVGKSGTRVRR